MGECNKLQFAIIRILLDGIRIAGLRGLLLIAINKGVGCRDSLAVDRALIFIHVPGRLYVNWKPVPVVLAGI